MKESMLDRIVRFLRDRLRQKRWRRAVTCLAAVVVFGVTYALILPAVTQSK